MPNCLTNYLMNSEFEIKKNEAMLNCTNYNKYHKQILLYPYRTSISLPLELSSSVIETSCALFHHSIILPKLRHIMHYSIIQPLSPHFNT